MLHASSSVTVQLHAYSSVQFSYMHPVRVLLSPGVRKVPVNSTAVGRMACLQASKSLE